MEDRERMSHSCELYVHVMEECVSSTGGPNVCVQCVQ